jgi:hypothetical protein
MERKLSALHGQPMRTLTMMLTGFLAVREPNLSQIGRALAQVAGTLDEKVKRMSRFLCQSRWDAAEAFLQVGQGIIESLAHAHPGRRILASLDWTDLGDYQGLWLSVPYHGRALPLACVVLPKDAGENVMTDTERELLRRFLERFPPEVRCRIEVLADRGFAKGELFDEIEQVGAIWGVRLPRDRQIQMEGEWIALRDVRMAPGETRVFRDVLYRKGDPRKIHLAVRRLPEGEAEDPDDDTWFIATSADDPAQVLEDYARRFLIEEMFRDLKGSLNMDRHRLGTEESVQKMMLIVALGYLILLEDGTQWRSRLDLRRIMKSTAWGKLSVFRIAEICFRWGLSEAPPGVDEVLILRWTNRRAA